MVPMTDKGDPDEFLEHRVVDAQDILKTGTLNGYLVVESWEDEAKDLLIQVKPDPQSYDVHFASDGTRIPGGLALESEQAVLRKRRLLLLGRKRSVLLDDLANERRHRAHAETELARLQKLLDAQKQEAAKAAEVLEARKAELSTERARADDADKKADATLASLRKLERHLAAVREQVGSREFERMTKDIA